MAFTALIPQVNQRGIIVKALLCCVITEAMKPAFDAKTLIRSDFYPVFMDGNARILADLTGVFRRDLEGILFSDLEIGIIAEMVQNKIAVLLFTEA